MSKKCLADASCPMVRAYDVIGDWWSLLIVSQIVLGGMSRFSEIQQALGLAKNILASRLRKLVEQGVLEKRPVHADSAYEQYVATPVGRDLYKVLIALRQWGDEHFPSTTDCAANLIVDRATGQPIAALEVRNAEGEVLTAQNVMLLHPDAITERNS